MNTSMLQCSRCCRTAEEPLGLKLPEYWALASVFEEGKIKDHYLCHECRDAFFDFMKELTAPAQPKPDEIKSLIGILEDAKSRFSDASSRLTAALQSHAMADSAPDLLAALRPFAIDVPESKENELYEVTCLGYHLRAVRAAIAKTEGANP